MGILVEIISQTGILLLRLIPFAVIGCLVSSLLRVYRKKIFTDKFFRLPLPAMIILCSIIGALSPFCTIGTVPVVIGLISCGLPAGAGAAFLSASSIVNPQIFMIQAASLGPKLAIIQAVSGIGIGITAGIIFTFFEKRELPLFNQKMPVQNKSDSLAKKAGYSVSLWINLNL